MDKYTDLLNRFSIIELERDQLLKQSLKKVGDHKDAIQLIKKCELSYPEDYLRSCGKSNFTDFPYVKLSNEVNDESKFIIARSIENEVSYFTLSNFIEVFDFMQSIVRRGYFDGMKSNSKKVRAHFNDGNELLIGKKSIEIKRFILEEANITSIIRRKRYDYDRTHTAIQSQIGALGGYIGYGTKMAINDKNRVMYNTKFNEIFTLNMPDLNISKLNSVFEYKDIDNIDVIWANHLRNKITYAFELELSNNLLQALHRLNIYAEKSMYQVTYLIIITPNYGDYNKISYYYTHDSYIRSIDLYHLTLNDFVELLTKRDQCINPGKLEKLLHDKMKKVSSYNEL